MPYTDKEKNKAYINRVSKSVSIRLMKESDSSIISWLDRQDHPTTAIKDVLRDHIEKEGN